MDFKKLALGLLFGGAIAAGAVACGGKTTGSTTTTGSTDLDVTGCNPAMDTADTGTQSFVISHLGLPATDGFNLDGINNASRPGGVGQNIPGCGKVDITGGIDNALSTIATALHDVIDLGGALQATLKHSLPDGGTAGALKITVTANHLAAGNAANDSCIGVSVLVQADGVADQTFTGKGAIANNVAYIVFDSTINFTVALTVPPASCNGGVCHPGSLSIAVQGARARVALNAAHTAITTGSILGGYIFYQDCTGGMVDSATSACVPGTGDYSAQNATGFQAALHNYATQVNLGTDFEAMAISAFGGAMDLHMNTNGTLGPCTGATAATVNKNSVSVALSIDSM